MLREIRKLFPDVLNFSVLNICNIMYILVEWEGFFAHQKSEIRIFTKKILATQYPFNILYLPTRIHIDCFY